MTVKIDRYASGRAFPSVLGGQFNELMENYVLRKGEVERVVGYASQVLMLQPRDKMRYGHKLWVDLNTGMLLMTRTYDDKHEVVEQFAFSQLQIGGNIDPEKVKPRFSTGGGRDWRVEDSAAVQADLGKAGWTIRSQPPGFRIVAQLTRSLGGKPGVGQIVLSDGLATVSVFIEPMANKPQATGTGLIGQGAINAYTRRLGNYWITVVGEAPAQSVKYIANAVEYRK
jgi:sigma-E factor negative regulatory protein RseB